MTTYLIFSLAIIVYLIFEIRDIKLLYKVTKLNRGTRSERKLVLSLLKFGIHPQSIFHDLIIQNYNNHYSQIDVVVVTKFGIIIFEVKEYNGWIFGNGKNKYWTQIMAYGKRKYRFYNPIKQNDKHIEVLRKQLDQFSNIPFYSFIIFYGNCSFRALDDIPDDTTLITSNRLKQTLNILLKSDNDAPYTNKIEIIDLLRKGVQDGGNKVIQRQHIENINKHYYN